MKIKEILKRLPVLPVTALVFYSIILLLWNIDLIPSPTIIVKFLENLYDKYGLFGLFLSSFLEGIVYLGLYFPGSFIIALAVFLSNGSFISLLLISIYVATALTITSFINYFLGRLISSHKYKGNKYPKKVGKALFLSMIHPNILAFYFFNQGIERKKLWKIIFVPIIMIPYGFIVAEILYLISSFAKQKIENPLFIFLLILLWLMIAIILNYDKKIKNTSENLKKEFKV
ncbi:MAG: hypothetical protein WC812_03300 [Candidatus Pacearchaeota archaeon]|jgi:membrane protein YqaA with SNARE-associated domain